MRILRAAATLASTLCLLACGSDDRLSAAGAPVLRWIDDDPPILDRSAFTELEPVFRWTFTSAADLAPWQGRQLIEQGIEDDRAVMLATGRDPRIQRSVELDADQIHVLEVMLVPTKRGTVELLWAKKLQRFAAARRSTLITAAGVGERVKSYRFDLASHPEWRGKIGRFRIDLPGDKDTINKLVEVTGYRQRLDRGELDRMLRRPWMVELDAEVRPALLASPGSVHARRLLATADHFLSFGYGLEPGVDLEVGFRVTALRPDGGIVELFSDTVDSSRAGRWLQATAALAELAGEQVELRLETTSPREADPRHGFPLWSNPVVLDTSSPRDRPNLLLVCLDTLRADRLSCYGHDLVTTPHIDTLAERAALFEKVVATSPWTLPSHVSMFTGLEAMRHGVNHQRPAPRSFEMLAEQLRDGGFTTGAVTGGGFLRPEFGFTQGFDSFSYWPEKKSKIELASNVDEALAWLSEHRDQPFFLFFHTYEVHYPHRRREPFFSRLTRAAAVDPSKSAIRMRNSGWRDLRTEGQFFEVWRSGTEGWQAPLTDGEKALVGLMYDSGVAYADAQVGRLLAGLDRLGLGDKTVVVVTSDHGEALGEDDRAGHAYLDDYNSLVPLIVALPDGRGAGSRVARQVRLTDLTPTVLDAVGLPWNPDRDGVSLLPLIDGEEAEVPAAAWTYSASNNRGLGLRLDNRLKYLYNNTAFTELAGEESIFDLVADPGERHDLAADDPRSDALRDRTRAAILDQHSGFRLLLRNLGPDTLTGLLVGGFARHDRIKSAHTSCESVRWRTDRGVAIRLAAGEELTLLFESLRATGAGITLRLVAPDNTIHHRLKVDFDLGGLGEPIGYRFDGSRWRKTDATAAEPPDTGFVLWHEGEPTAPIADEAEADDEAVEQLRALGYVE